MYKLIRYLIAVVWLANGLFCKILNLVPRHQEIVGIILGNEYSFYLTKFIGILEVSMFVWILSKIKSKICAVTQISVVMIMNTIEFMEVPNLLLFGKWNIIFAGLFSILIYYNEFVLRKK